MKPHSQLAAKLLRRRPARAPARKKTLSLKQRKFIDGRLRGKSSSEAAREAGYSESVARHADRISESPNVRGAIEDILQVSGFSDEQLGTRIAERLNATIVLRATRYGKREVVVNFTERREMVQLVLRLKGYLIERHDVRVRRWRKSSRIPTEEKDPTNETRRKCSEVLSHRTADNLESAPTLCASAFPPTVYVSHRRGKIPSRTSVNMNA